MTYKITQVVLKHTDTASLVVVGDPHYGSTAQDRRLIRQMIKYTIDTPNAYLVTMGDNLDLSIAGKHGAIGDTMSVNDAIDLFRSDFREVAIQGKFLGTVQGNHDTRITKATGSICDLVEQTFNEWNDAYNLNIQYGTPDLILDFRVGRSTFVGFMTHGSGGGGTPGASVNANARSTNIINNADFYLQGHYHKVNESVSDRVFYDPSRVGVGKINFQKQHFFTAGYCVKHEGYARAFRLAYTRPHALVLTMNAVPESNHSKTKQITQQWIEGSPD